MRLPVLGVGAAFFVRSVFGSVPFCPAVLSPSLATRPNLVKGVPSRERQLGGSTKLGLPKGLAEKLRPSPPAAGTQLAHSEPRRLSHPPRELALAVGVKHESRRRVRSVSR